MLSRNYLKESYNISFFTLIFCLFSILVLSLRLIPLQPYEKSFFEDVPFYIPFILILSYFLFGIITFNNGKESYLLVTSLAFTFILSSMWILKYDSFYGYGDPYVHLMIAQSITNTGRLDINQYPTSSFYPGLHFLISILSQLLYLDLKFIFIWIWPILSLFYVLLIWLISKEFLQNFAQRICLLLLPLSSMLIFSESSVSPFGLSIISFLINLYFFVKCLRTEFSNRWLFLLGFSFFSLIIIHIMTAIFLLGIFFVCTMVYLVLTFRKENEERTSQWKQQTGLKILIISSVGIIVLLIFLFSSEFIANIMNMIIKELLTFESSQFTDQTYRPFWDFLFKRFNLLLQTLFVGIILFILAIQKVTIKKTNSILLIVFIFFFIYSTIFTLILYLVASELGVYGRIPVLASILFPIYLSYGFEKTILFVSQFKTRHLIFRWIHQIKFLLPFLIALIFGISLFGTWFTSSSGYYSKYTTNGMINGLIWADNHINWTTSKILSGDQGSVLARYLFGEQTEIAFHGGQNALLLYLGYNPKDFKNRGSNEMFIRGNKTVYIFYDSIMGLFFSNPRYRGEILAIKKTDLDLRDDLQKIYSNEDFVIYLVLSQVEDYFP